jgi:DNA-binding NarL/FixJ family response regulator
MGAGVGADRNGRAGSTVAVLGKDERRRRTAAALLTEGGFAVAAEVADVEELEGQLHANAPDCVVLLADGGEANGDEIRHVRGALPTAAILCIADSAARRVVVDKLDAGADGIVLLDDLEAQLSTAVHAVCSGQLSLPRELRSWFGKPRLSPREKQVLSMVVLGFTNREIANKLFLAESTIKSHLSSAFEKLGVRSRSDAVALILDSKNGLGTGILTILDEEPAIASPAS